MTLPTTVSAATPQEEILGRLVLALENASDRDAIVKQFRERHPEHAEAIQSLAGTERLIKLSEPGPPPTRLQPNDRLGLFRIIRFIQAGGMGEIYEAEQTDLKRSVALKVIRPDKADEHAKARFAREREVLAKLHQTHIVPVFASGEENGLQFFAMHFIDGASLAHVVRVLSGRETIKTATTAAPSLASVVQAIQNHRTKNGDLIDSSPTASGKAIDAEPPPSRTSVPVLTQKYFRSVAQAMADAADAIQATHELGICHRDLKPSNFMIEPSGKCWLIDFGLATSSEGADLASRLDQSSQLAPRVDSSDSNLTNCWLGTPQYMAPEQFDRTGDQRLWDVWGLGATLYELLTMKPPYEGEPAKIHERAQRESPVPPRTLTREIPRDLDAICMKAVSREPRNRYATAKAFGDDLRRSLTDRATSARPDWITLRPVRLWAWRNTAWAAAILVCLTGVVAAVISMFQFDHMKIETANVRTKLANEQKAKAESVAKAKDHELALFELQRLRLTERVNGWSGKSWEKAKSIVDSQGDLELRNQAAATLVGFDAVKHRRFNIDGSSVAFSRNGKQLLIGGTDTHVARLWDGTQSEPIAFKSRGNGPVVFSADGTPMQLTAEKDFAMLWDVKKEILIRKFQMPAPTKSGIATIAISPDGKLVAAGAERPDGSGSIAVWNIDADKPVFQSANSATSMAFSADSKLFAAGADDGQINVWSLPQGDLIASPKSDRATINALAFGREVRRHENANSSGQDWILGAGDLAGAVTIWDLTTKSVRATCRGSNCEINAITFSPDGMTLASAGRSSVNVWDSCSGRLLLGISENNLMTDIAYSPTGGMLAVSSISANRSRGCVTIWEIEPGRGVQSLLGLNAEVAKLAMSPDDRLLAALSQDSRVAVWDLAKNRLMYVFDAPRTRWTDNGAIAFSPDGRKLAYSGSALTEGHAKLWDLENGKESQSWLLPPGLNNLLVFQSNSKLLLFQKELKDHKIVPHAGVDRKTNPIVGRVYELVPGNGKLLAEIKDFDDNIQYPSAPLDGRFIAIVGYDRSNSPIGRRVEVFDPLTGKEFWTTERETEQLAEIRLNLQIDRTGRYLAIGRLVEPSGQCQSSLVEMPSGKLLPTSDRGFISDCGIDPDLPYSITHEHPKYVGRLSVIPMGGIDPVLVAVMDKRQSGNPILNSTGTRVVWGHANGTVTVCDIEEVRRRLTSVGLGW